MKARRGARKPGARVGYPAHKVDNERGPPSPPLAQAPNTFRVPDTALWPPLGYLASSFRVVKVIAAMPGNEIRVMAKRHKYGFEYAVPGWVINSTEAMLTAGIKANLIERALQRAIIDETLRAALLTVCDTESKKSIASFIGGEIFK